MAQATTTTTTDHEAIRRWVEERGGWPASVKRTRGERGKGDPGIIRIDFPGYSGEGSLDRIGWDEFFSKFDDNKLAFVCQEATSGGEKSNFNKIVKQATAKARAQRRSTGAKRAAPESGRRKTAQAAARSARARSTKSAKKPKKSTRSTTAKRRGR
jgi:hypothetical protein